MKSIPITQIKTKTIEEAELASIITKNKRETTRSKVRQENFDIKTKQIEIDITNGM